MLLSDLWSACGRERSRSRHYGNPSLSEYMDVKNVPPNFASYSLGAWPHLYPKTVGQDVSSIRYSMTTPIRPPTGCTCTAAPTMALDMLLGRKNTVEIYGSETNGANSASVTIEICFLKQHRFYICC